MFPLTLTPRGENHLFVGKSKPQSSNKYVQQKNNKLLKVFHESSINFLTHKLMNIFKVQNTRELNEHAS